MEIKALECLKIIFFCGRGNQVGKRELLNYMLSVFRKRNVSGMGRERGRDGEAITSSGLHFNSHLIHGKSPCLLKKKKKKAGEIIKPEISLMVKSHLVLGPGEVVNIPNTSLLLGKHRR